MNHLIAVGTGGESLWLISYSRLNVTSDCFCSCFMHPVKGDFMCAAGVFFFLGGVLFFVAINSLTRRRTSYREHE